MGDPGRAPGRHGLLGRGVGLRAGPARLPRRGGVLARRARSASVPAARARPRRRDRQAHPEPARARVRRSSRWSRSRGCATTLARRGARGRRGGGRGPGHAAVDRARSTPHRGAGLPLVRHRAGGGARCTGSCARGHAGGGVEPARPLRSPAGGADRLMAPLRGDAPSGDLGCVAPCRSRRRCGRTRPDSPPQRSSGCRGASPSTSTVWPVAWPRSASWPAWTAPARERALGGGARRGAALPRRRSRCRTSAELFCYRRAD